MVSSDADRYDDWEERLDDVKDQLGEVEVDEKRLKETSDTPPPDPEDRPVGGGGSRYVPDDERPVDYDDDDYGQ